MDTVLDIADPFTRLLGLRRGAGRAPARMPAHAEAARYSTRRLFEDLDGRVFTSGDDFRAAVLELYNANLVDFPSSYTHRDAIAWARKQGWLVKYADQSKLRVRVPPREA